MMNERVTCERCGGHTVQPVPFAPIPGSSRRGIVCSPCFWWIVAERKAGRA